MKKYHNITVLKGIACIGVMIGHFVGIIKYADKNSFHNWFCLFLENDYIIFNEAFWLYLFFIASGFLLAQTNIEKSAELIKKIVLRFARLGLPVLFSSLIVWSIYITIGFKNGETATLFTNAWYQNAYQLKGNVLLSALGSPVTVLLMGMSSLNSPFWVLRNMFIASIGIYAHRYILNVLKKKDKYSAVAVWLFNIIYLCVALRSNKIVKYTVMGELISLYVLPVYATLKIKMKYLNIIVVTIALADLAVFQATHQYSYAAVFFALIILASIDCTINPKSKMLCLGNISFGIYALHWPLICAVGAQIILHLSEYTIFNRVLAAIAVCTVLSVIAAVLFHITFEKISLNIVNKMKVYLYRT